MLTYGHPPGVLLQLMTRTYNTSPKNQYLSLNIALTVCLTYGTRMRYKHRGGLIMSVSANGTYSVGPGATVTDAFGTVYAINNAGQVTINGRVDLTTNRVDGLGYADGRVWQKNDDNLWYSKTSATATWVDFPAAYGNPLAVAASSDNTIVQPGGDGPNASYFYDTHANTWSINAAGQVVVDSRIDVTTARVVQMDLVNGVIWQENADGNWYSKTKPSDTWTAAVRTDPIVAATALAETWVGGQGNNSPTLGSNWSGGRAPTPHQSLTMTAGTMNLGGGNLVGDTLTISGEKPASLPNIVFGGYEAVAPVINMTAGAALDLAFKSGATNAVKVNVTGGQALLTVGNPYPSTADVIINADKLSSVLLKANMVFGRLTETGGTVVLNGDSRFSGVAVLLSGDLAGTGTMTMGGAQSSRASLEVAGSIGAGVSIIVRGQQERGAGSMVLDHAALDRGTITMVDAVLELRGVGAVDGESYKNSVLTLYHGNTALESIKLVSDVNLYEPVGNGTLHFGKDAAGSVFAYHSNVIGTAQSGSLIPLAVHA